MVIHDAHKTINALKQALPGSFVFVLDTTDRSFLYKSKTHEICQKAIIDIDKELGIEILSREEGHYIRSCGDFMVGFRMIGSNTYVGFCMPEDFRHESDSFLAQQIIKNEVHSLSGLVN
ncbi:MAG: hypothetical protein AAF391_12170 [Bacteroidota bacterium]